MMRWHRVDDINDHIPLTLHKINYDEFHEMILYLQSNKTLNNFYT